MMTPQQFCAALSPHIDAIKRTVGRDYEIALFAIHKDNPRSHVIMSEAAGTAVDIAEKAMVAAKELDDLHKVGGSVRFQTRTGDQSTN